MKPMQKTKGKRQICFAFGVVASSPTTGLLILPFAFLIELAGRNG